MEAADWLLPGPWTVVWDRHNIHSRSRLVQEWLVGEPDVVLEDLPGYTDHYEQHHGWIRELVGRRPA